MRFNKNEMITLAQQPAHKFDKEGVLLIWEKQEGFFKRTEKQGSSKRRKSKSLQELSCYTGTNKASIERWCRLRGNLLFYTKTNDQFSEPVGVVVLLHCTIRIDHSLLDGTYGFFLVFDSGITQHFATYTESERDAWLEAIQVNNYNHVRSMMVSLQEELELKQNHDPDLDIQMWRIRKGHHALDIVELPLCEVSLSCDNLLCDGHGKPPRAVLVLHVYIPQEDIWLKYANTETIDKSSNPTFLKTVYFWPSDGLNGETCIRITAYDVREKLSGLATPLGSAKFYLSTLLDCQQTKFRVQLLSSTNEVAGFLTLTIWRHERESSLNKSTESTPSRSLHHQTLLNVPCHRRTQSLPSRFNVKQKLPYLGPLQYFCANALLTTYRFHSGLGGDITVHEIMVESKLCFSFPQQLLEVWMSEEKELLQEVAGMGELVEPWNNRQLEVLDRHLQLLHMYSQAKEHLRSFKSGYFKPSSRKKDRSLEFAPVNLHLQKMWIQNETLKKNGFYDVITVGAFTKHSQRKNGGLIKLIQQLKESPAAAGAGQISLNKIASAYDAIQAIKLLRREVVDGMKTLIKLARKKQAVGMLPICEDMVSKTRILLTLWDSGLVEEALNFIEENKVTRPGKTESPGVEELSPLRKIAQQITLRSRRVNNEELMSPDELSNQSNIWNLLPTSSLNDSSLELPAETILSFPDCNNGTSKSSGPQSKPEENQEDAVELSKMFLDIHTMCSSPSANYYKPTDEPEPWDLTQLNIEASVMCLVSKVKFLCGKCGSPSVRLRNQKPIIRAQNSFTRDVRHMPDTNANDVPRDRNGSANQAEKPRNKFTEGLDFDSLSDWTTELKPSMQKLRQAMDGLLKTARLTHSVFRIQEDRRLAQTSCNIRYRRHVCFSQALTSLVTGLMTKLWCQKVDPLFLHILMTIGPIAEFEALLSYYADEIDMWGDMVVAVEDLSTVYFTLVASKSKSDGIVPQMVASRSTLDVLIPVPEAVFTVLQLSKTHSFQVTPVFFNIGINEFATLAESLGATRPQEQSNIDNFDKLNEYYHRFKKLSANNITDSFLRTSLVNAQQATSLNELIQKLKNEVHANKHKNVDILNLSGQICRKMKGLRFTSCKSAKDRTAMAVTLEQADILSSEYDLDEHEYQRVLDCMRAEGVRRENTFKNIGIKKYSFNAIQVLTFPKLYRPPPGTYGAVQS